ncbi:4Fe-4S single cluster domain-containing protein [Spiroplasma turonicum]|uniref:Thiol peroxidase n=1 Tax=Spiroplasma turonicum TaxID=216946 RepID=A0A0K1P7E3_9MOLU|nr:4Fe-4S single cluster domain-containing protein [Spiroplasma turonicum]AKU80220.1 thiol peroxidase [Spiroplasma turonicum]ALX71220.1 thiol peroxidase [Spiroplasma turonicum]
MANLNISKFLMCSEIEGPGKRFVIWFQGCNLRCFNCSNQEQLSFDKKMFLPVSLILERINYSKDKYNIEGITLLGGEPFMQPDGLLELTKGCQELGLTVICFTGYLIENLLSEFKNILNNIDIIIDGPFIFKQLDLKRRLIGSKNQRVIKLSDKYKESDYFEKPYSEVEIQIYNNRVSINGDGTVFDDEKGKFDFKLK